MDWLTFFATIVSAFAWPSVAIVLLIILKDHLGGLASRVEELRFPGGAKAKFVKELDSVRKQSEKIGLAARFSRGNIRVQAGQFLGKEELELLQLANKSPEAVILESYREIEEVIIKYFEQLPETIRSSNPLQLIDDLFNRGFLNKDARELFEKLRTSRNSAAHASQKARVTPGEAIEYREHARLFADLLEKAILDFTKAVANP